MKIEAAISLIRIYFAHPAYLVLYLNLVCQYILPDELRSSHPFFYIKSSIPPHKTFMVALPTRPQTHTSELQSHKPCIKMQGIMTLEVAHRRKRGQMWGAEHVNVDRSNFKTIWYSCYCSTIFCVVR